MTGSELKQHRQCLDLTQKELAVSLCVTVRAVVSWETGSRNMPACCERLFCLLYGLPFVMRQPVIDDLTPELFGEE